MRLMHVAGLARCSGRQQRTGSGSGPGALVIPGYEEAFLWESDIDNTTDQFSIDLDSGCRVLRSSLEHTGTQALAESPETPRRQPDILD